MEAEEPQSNFVEQTARKWQHLLDKTSPHLKCRWASFGIMLCMYVLRVYLLSGWYVVTYGLAIYMLNQLIGFLSPQFDPDDEDIDLDLPTREKEEFRPFARRLPEFKFWYTMMRSTLIAFGMTFFTIFDVPVFWPILVMYFFVLFYATMQKRIKHMIKHKYVPWSFGKKKYAGKSPLKSDK